MKARTRDPEATRAAILDGAEAVFLAKGYGNAATSEIAQRAGVTKSLLHHHFGSKADLWAEVKVRRFSIYARKQMEMIESSEPKAELLRESMGVYFHFLLENPEMVRMMAWMALDSETEQECLDLDRDLTMAGIAKIREAQEQGLFRSDVNPGFVLLTMLGICQHWFQHKAWMLGHLGLSTESQAVDETFLEDASKLFFEGLLPRES